MLPFLKNKNNAGSGLAITYRKPDESQASSADDIEAKASEGDHALEAAANDLSKALRADDIAAIARALRAAVQILNSEPEADDDGLDMIE